MEATACGRCTWRSPKNFKAHNTKGKGGHLGCSEGFNWNSYKHVVDGKVNSQGREQMHSLLDNCAESLRLMSYQNFMIFMRGKVHNIMAAIFILLYDFFKLNEVMPSGSEESSPETIRCLLS